MSREVRHHSGAERPSERKALDDLFSIAYEELRRLAGAVKRSDPSLTLTPTALVNEAWLKLAHTPQCALTSRLHFKRIAARAMRQVLIEAARRRCADKRGGTEIAFVVLDESIDTPVTGGEEILKLEDALQELERVEPRQAMLVESRFFGGLDVGEVAVLLDVSEATVHREWRVAKAWLAHRMKEA